MIIDTTRCNWCDEWHVCWKVPALLNPSESSYLEMVLVDEKAASHVVELDSDGSFDDTDEVLFVYHYNKLWLSNVMVLCRGCGV
ncbi:hypothetical protein P8452_23501 [Trifolium repens]|nr:hypothetical protein P8452_23501 [Trifolium repens]